MQKIILIGLEGSGKTALYQQFFQKKPVAHLEKIPATRGIARYEHDFLRSDFLILDTGGGKEYRKGYIGNVELVSNVSAVVFVVDVQNARKFQEVSDFFTVWVKSVTSHLSGVKGYLLFNKIDPGMEGQLKANLQQIAGLLAPLDSLFPGELFKTITTIHNDSVNQTIQRILLDVLPRKMSKPKEIKTVPPPPQEQVKVQPPVVSESFLTQPVKPPAVVTPPSIKTTKVSVPVLSKAPVEQPIPTVAPPAIGKSLQMDKAQEDAMREKTAERLSDIIAGTIDNNPTFVAIAVYTEDAERVVGAVQQGSSSEILQTIEETLRKINLEQYMSTLGKARVGGEGHLQIETFEIFFEKVSPEHLSTVICSKLEEDTIKVITQLNRYLNQALSITPGGGDESSFKRSDLMTELKMRLHNRGKSVDEIL